MILLVFCYFDILSLIKKKNILGFSAFPASVCLFVCFFRAIDYILIARRIRCSAGVSRKGGTPLFGLVNNDVSKDSPIERIHMTSRRPYWCSKTMKWWPCWCTKKILWELNSFSYVQTFFCSCKLA